ncbi:molybdenum ABC transporter ATP-binding protein [Xanthobacter autotrophicus]|nr:molybdenum ABC transporter ATP-binding protein [Xanthobacter autotrophicus]MDI4656103.1 molybdenum ABC transporter ATP-binding protein [Xanthobacter autotrophicus]
MIEIDVSLARSTGFCLEAHFAAPDMGVTALFGRSGSGKTTIIQVVAGSVRPDRGRIQVGGEVFFDSEKGIDLPMERRGAGYVFQDARLFPHMSVDSNLRYGERRAKREITIRFDAVVDMLGIGHLLKRRPHTLSGGEKQRVAIGRALLSQPRLLLMDEPLASLDEMRKGEILPYLERLRDELQLPILYVSHSVEEVLRLSDAVAAVADGKVIASGALADVLSRPELLPVLGRFDLGTIFDCIITAHNEEFGLSTVSFPDGELRVPLVGRPVGAPARVRVRSRDVSLSLSRPIDVSVTNRLSGTIASITRAEGPFADVEVALAHGKLHSLVTQESVQRLALEPGMAVWAMIKAVTVDSRPAGFNSPGAEIRSPSPVSRPRQPSPAPPALRVIAGGTPPKAPS